MTENIDNLILEHLKAIRLELAEVKADTGDMKYRMRGIDASLIAPYLRARRIASDHTDLAQGVVDAREDRY